MTCELTTTNVVVNVVNSDESELVMNTLFVLAVLGDELEG